MKIATPYLLFLGDAPDQLSAKVARGIKDWRPDNCVGQFKMDDCHADLGIADMSLAQARNAGAKTLVIGVANRGGYISDEWISVLSDALDQGFDLAAGLHNRLIDIPVLAAKAKELGRALHDVRFPTEPQPIGTGIKRTGKRLLAVGTDCSVGKMYTTLAIDAEMRTRDMKVTFRATGQTGILITGDGISIDAVIADFIAGSVEKLAPDNDDDHWDIIEGQGSLFHASYAGVTAGLIHGSQADALVLCHEPSRTHMRGLPGYALPSLSECMAMNLQMAQRTNPAAKFIGVSINTAALDEKAAQEYLSKIEKETDLPTVDPFRHGASKIVDQLS